MTDTASIEVRSTVVTYGNRHIQVNYDPRHDDDQTPWVFNIPVPPTTPTAFSRYGNDAPLGVLTGRARFATVSEANTAAGKTLQALAEYATKVRVEEQRLADALEDILPSNSRYDTEPRQ